jgi:hypothetical protein
VKRSPKIPRKNRAIRSGALQALERRHPVTELRIRTTDGVETIKLKRLR